MEIYPFARKRAAGVGEDKGGEHGGSTLHGKKADQGKMGVVREMKRMGVGRGGTGGEGLGLAVEFPNQCLSGESAPHGWHSGAGWGVGGADESKGDALLD